MKRSEEIKRGPLFRAPGPRTQGSMRIEREKERESWPLSANEARPRTVLLFVATIIIISSECQEGQACRDYV